MNQHLVSRALLNRWVDRKNGHEKLSALRLNKSQQFALLEVPLLVKVSISKVLRISPQQMRQTNQLLPF